jgi:RecQ zinc-binding
LILKSVFLISSAECVVLYRFQDISKITTMMFTEYTGLKNAYSMISFCIDGNKCRRSLISKHFSDVWDGQCDRMCDRCYYDDKIPAKKIYLAKHLNTLCQLIDHAENLDVKLTGLKLLDAWYHKGPNKLRLDNSFAPDFDRYYGEQIVAYCLIHNYLKEDFHFTAYAANSYIKRGQNSIKPGGDVDFQPARVLRLPTKSLALDNEVMFVDESRLLKKRHSEGSDVSPQKRHSTNKKERTESTVVLTSDDDIKVHSKNARVCDSPAAAMKRKSGVERPPVGPLRAKVNFEKKRRNKNETATSSSLQLSEDELIEISSPLETIEID